MKIQFELTDTFGGEANYSWVRRSYYKGQSESETQIVREAKKWAGLSGLRCEKLNMGDTVMLRPLGKYAPCLVLFITWENE